MLSSLPPVLLRDILEATVPHTFHTTTYNARQETLRSFSLVSKLLRSIAQPLLLETVRVESVRQLEILPPSIDEGGRGDPPNKRIKSAVITLETGVDFLAENVKTGFRKFEHVESLTLYGVSERRVDMTLISSFQSKMNSAFAVTSQILS